MLGCYYNFVLFIAESSGGVSRDELIDKVASDILDKLPSAFETWRVKKQTQISLTPTGVVLLQELDRFNLLVMRIKITLEHLKKVRAEQKKFYKTLHNLMVKAMVLKNSIFIFNFFCPLTFIFLSNKISKVLLVTL